MKNLMKMLLVSLTAISFSVANAGELSITGDAKALQSLQVMVQVVKLNKERFRCI